VTPAATVAPLKGNQGVHIEIQAGSRPVSIEIETSNKQKKAVTVAKNSTATIDAPAVPVSQPAKTSAAVLDKKAATGDKKEVAKLEKMREIQDTVKALRKQLEDIDKKDKDDDKEVLKKDDEDDDVGEQSHALLISEKRGQIFAEKEVSANETKNETANETKPVEESSNTTTADQKEKEGKYERFVKAQR